MSHFVCYVKRMETYMHMRCNGHFYALSLPNASYPNQITGPYADNNALFKDDVEPLFTCETLDEFIEKLIEAVEPEVAQLCLDKWL